MNLPKLELNELYYMFGFGYGGKYVKFLTYFFPLIPSNDIYSAEIVRSFDYTKPFTINSISLYEYNKSIIIHESKFEDYKEIIRTPALNLSKRQNDIYIRQITIDNIIKNL